MSSNASRLATLWLNRQSSQLDPPPAMVKAITEWIQDDYLSRVLALSLKPSEDHTDYDTLKKFLANPSDQNYSDVLNVLDTNLGFDLKFRWRQMSDPAQRRTKKFKELVKEVQERLDDVRETRIKSKQKWQEISALLNHPTPPVTPDAVEDTSTHKFHMDLSGWRYAPKMPKAMTLPVVTVYLRPLQAGVAASWDPKNWVLSLPLLASRTLRDWKVMGHYIRHKVPGNVYHECQHMAQGLLALASGSGNRGLPSKRILTPQWKQNASPSQTLDVDALHDMDDSEFYPMLQTAIYNSKPYFKSLPQDERRTVLEQTVQGKWQDTPELERAALFFRALKKHAPGKYRKAVSEFISAVL